MLGWTGRCRRWSLTGWDYDNEGRNELDERHVGPETEAWWHGTWRNITGNTLADTAHGEHHPVIAGANTSKDTI
jgi:hypothetical protein